MNDTSECRQDHLTKDFIAHPEGFGAHPVLLHTAQATD